jgi:glycosyltransferase involved in cell wall biosynthesis
MAFKIALVLNTSWNAFNFRKGLINSFLASGNEVLIIAPEDEYSNDLIGWGVTYHPINLKSTGMNPLEDWKYKSDLQRILKSEKPDVLLGFTIKPNIYGALAARSLRVPMICNVSGLGTTFLWKGWLKRIAVTLYNRSFSRTDYIFFQNADDRKLFLEHVSVSEQKTGLLPGSGINLEEYRASPLQLRKPLTFLMIARLIVEKGVREFIEAAKIVHQSHPDIRFELIGKYDPEHSRSISQEEFASLAINGINYRSEERDIISVIEKADVIVLPSYREGTPRTLLEAAAMGRPLIATDVPGCREVVDDGINGFLCKERSSNSLAQKISLFIALSEDEQRRMGIASRRLVEDRFDEKIVIEEYSRKIQQLLTQPLLG